jgi:hypothetical protein
MSGALYLRRFSAARRYANSTPADLFAESRFKIFGIRRAVAKLGASLAINLEELDARELEQLRIEIASHVRNRTSKTS